MALDGRAPRPGEEEVDVSAATITVEDGQKLSHRPTGGLTAADLADFPDDGLRRELIDGLVMVSPAPSGAHQWAESELESALRRNVPDDMWVSHGCGVHVGPEYLIPDVLALDWNAVEHDSGYDASVVRLAIEVVSPSSVVRDRVTKPALYAECGIRYYWRLVQEPEMTLYCHQLDRTTGSYAEPKVFGPGEKVVLTEPWPIEFAVDGLIRSRRR
jgi:Uma2 family endonuclease